MDPLLCTVTLQVSTFCLLQRKQQAGNVQHRGAISEERQVKLVERAFARFAFIFPHTHTHIHHYLLPVIRFSHFLSSFSHKHTSYPVLYIPLTRISIISSMPFANFFQSAASKKRASLSDDTSTHKLPPSPSSPAAAPNSRRWSHAIPSPSTDTSSPSTRRMRQRFSSLLSSNGSRKSFSVLSFDSLTSGSIDDNDHQPRYSSSSDESFHQPPTPPAHNDTTAIASSYLMTKNNNIHPATIEEESITSFTSLAEQVRVILGSTLDEVDEEIELEWEDHRKNLRQSLLEPKRHLSLPLQL